MYPMHPPDKPNNKIVRTWVITLVSIGAFGLISAAAVIGLGINSGVEAASQAAATQSANEAKASTSASFWASVNAQNKAAAAAAEQQRQAFESSQAKNAQQDVDDQLAAQRWKAYGNDLYYQWADNSEYTCGYNSCSYLHVMTMKETGCRGGIYVEASLESGQASIGRANAWTAALPKQKDAIVELEDNTGQADGFQLTTLNCH